MKFKLKIKNFFVKTLLLILASSFVLFGIINFFGNVGETNIVKINNEKINFNNFTNYLNNKRNRILQSKISDKDMSFINSKDFVNLTLREFIKMSLLDQEIEKLNLKQPKISVFDEIYKDESFKNENGEFDLNKFNNFLSSNQINEDNYIKMFGTYNSRNILNQLITGSKLDSNFISKQLIQKFNKFFIVDIITISPENLSFEYKRPSKEEIKKYYEEHSEKFLVNEEKVISSIIIDLNKYKNNEDELKNKLSELEDLTISAKNIDEISKIYNTKKHLISYFVDDKESLDKLPNDLNAEMLKFGVGTFSNLIYKDNNIYKIYYIEKINPAKKLSLKEAEDKIVFELIAKNKDENTNLALDKITKQMRINGVDSTVLRNNLKIEKNEKIYNNLKYSDILINEIMSLKRLNTFSKPIYNKEKNIYEVAYLKDIKSITDNDKNYISEENIKNKLSISYKNSLIYLFQDYLINSNEIIVNTRLLNSLQ